MTRPVIILATSLTLAACMAPAELDPYPDDLCVYPDLKGCETWERVKREPHDIDPCEICGEGQ